MTDHTTLAPAQRGPIERTGGTATRSPETGAGQSYNQMLFLTPFEGGAEQSWAGPGVDWFPFEGGAA